MKFFRSRGGQRATRSAMAVGLLSLVVYGVSVSTSTASTRPHATKHASCNGPWGWCGTAATGYKPTNEPNNNPFHTGKPLVALMTAGPTNDGGYYQSEKNILVADSAKFGWAKPIIDDNVPPGNALTTAEDLCREHVDLVVVGESELASFAGAPSNPVCKDVAFWLYTSLGVVSPKGNPYWYQAQDAGDPPLFVGGYEAGLWMRAHHTTKAGFVTFCPCGFTERPAKALLAGMRYAAGKKITEVFNPNGFNTADSVEAAQGMIHAGVHMIYPFLGLPTFAVANAVDKAGANYGLISPGSAYCSRPENWAVSILFDPGYYLQYALPKFQNGSFRTGYVQTFNLGGGHPAPAVQACHPLAGEATAVANLEKKILSHKLNITPLINAANYS